MKTPPESEFKFLNSTVRIEENLHKRLSNHLNMLKYATNQKITKKGWATDAIQEKLELEQNQSVEELSSDKFLNFRISQDLDDEIEKRVQIACENRVSFSKKLWIVEAIHEKLDRDEKETKKLLEKKCGRAFR